VAIVHSNGYLFARSFGGVAFIVAFLSLLMRALVKREGAIARGDPPKELSFRGLRSTKSKWWWFPTWFIKTPAGWRKLDRVLVVAAILAAVVAIGAILTIRLAGLR
jgi:hypothetical protein